MSQSLPLPPPGFETLSSEDQLDYVTSLWDHLAANPEKVPVPNSHRKVIRERLEGHRADPDAGIEWSEVRDRIRKRLEV